MSKPFIVVNAVNIEPVARALRQYEPAIHKEIDAMQKDVAYGIRDEAKTYEAPPAPTGRPMQWESAEHRSKVMFMIRQGIINVPYQRTGDMSRQTVAYRGDGGWKVEMRSSYAPFVRGGMQSHQHTGRWIKWTTIIRRHRAGLLAKTREALLRAREMVGL